jgi:putative ABC transport system ATP-binding protein
MATNTSPSVTVRDVHKHYHVGDHDVPVLHGVSFDVQRGEMLAIVGPSGNGKSTLLNLIAGIDRPTRGAVVVDGFAVHDKSEDQLAAWRATQVGVVFQFFQLLPALSLLHNVILPMELAGAVPGRERRARALALLDQVGLADQAGKLPSQVSGGQQQRAAIARALANDPPLLIADEPTGNLDAEMSAEVFSLFRGLVAGGKTLIMVTHNPDLAAQVDRVIEIISGRLYREKTGTLGWHGEERLPRLSP